MPIDARLLAARFLEGIGVAELSLAVAGERIRARFADRFRLRESRDPREALDYLSTLTFPATRHVAFPTPSGVALVNNSRNGSDYADHVVLLPRQLGCRFVRVVNTRPRVWSRGGQREVMRYEARIFDLRDTAGDVVRSVCCMNDGGRWVFDTQGAPHPLEADFPYAAARKAARFTEAHLFQLAAAYGLRCRRRMTCSRRGIICSWPRKLDATSRHVPSRKRTIRRIFITCAGSAGCRTCRRTRRACLRTSRSALS